MRRSMTEQQWVMKYVQKTSKPLPIVLGTSGAWTGNGKPLIILIGFTLIDVLTLGDIYDVAHHPVRKMEIEGLTYYAINIIDKKQVKKIVEDWKK
jgi:CO dehydrogenase/acetyl-CoA synthase alpha subunit